MGINNTAHINPTTRVKETVEEHALRTAVLCEKYAKEIGEQESGFYFGLFHDTAGKSTERFGNVLEHKEIKVNHAVSSAAVMFNEFPGLIKSPEWQTVMYYIIKGHHAGLGENYEFDPDFKEIIREEAERIKTDWDYETDGRRNAFSDTNEYENCVHVVEELVKRYKARIQKLSEQEDRDFEDNEQKMTHIRMMLSCAVDADYTATSQFQKETGTPDDDNGEYRDEINLDIDDCLTRLDDYRNALIRKATGTTDINRLRNYVYECAENAGKTHNAEFLTMTAPTGTAKTLAFIKFALESAKKNRQRRIFIVVPYLTITEQTANLYKTIFGDDVVLEDDSRTKLTEQTKILAERWSAPIIITTNVRFYETLFSNRPSVLRKLHNITHSVVIFDESQSLRTDLADITIKTLQKLTAYNTSVVLATATPPAYGFRKRLEYNPTEIIRDTAWLYGEYNKIRRNRIDFLQNPVSFQSLAEMYGEHKEKLYIFNTNKKAMKMYNCLCQKYGEENCYLIGKYFCSAHKKTLLNEIKAKLELGLPCYVSSTQCIEAGVDIDFPCLLREYAPITALIQSFGRLNRNAKTIGIGTVFFIGGADGQGYPDTQYRNETEITKSIIQKHNWDISLNDEEIIKQYYGRIFGAGCIEEEDREEIREALEACNFEKMAEHYKIIDSENTISVIVPYIGETELYMKLKNKLVSQGMVIKREDMRNATPITVSVYDDRSSDYIRNNAEQLSVRLGEYTEPTNWYLLTDESHIYNDKTGLYRTEEEKGGVSL